MVLTQEAWAQLRNHMPAAGFPVLRQLGQYQLESAPAPLWVYEVSFCEATKETTLQCCMHSCGCRLLHTSLYGQASYAMLCLPKQQPALASSVTQHVSGCSACPCTALSLPSPAFLASVERLVLSAILLSHCLAGACHTPL